MKRSERGQNLVETAIIIPILLLLLAGVIDLGRTFSDYMSVTNATREGARRSARLPCSALARSFYGTQIRDAVIAEAANRGITLTPEQVALEPDPVNAGCPGLGDAMIVRVDYPFSFLIMGGFLDTTDITLPAAIEVSVYGSGP
jgi:Flp pilus assembly protein TadG